MAAQNNVEKGKVPALDIEKLVKIINSINFGSVTVFIQEGKITQIEKSEKVRLK